jgi:CheY-like chemotaxis protein
MTRPHPHRVLVVDDQLAVAEVVRGALEEAGYAVTLTSTGVRALNLVAYDAPDVVLLDLGLPDMLGMEVLDRQVAEKPDI